MNNDNIKDEKWYKTVFRRSATALKLEKSINFSVKMVEGSCARASTDPTDKIIYLRKEKSDIAIALSYAYELINAKNSLQYSIIFQQAPKLKTIQYVRKIMALEAKAAFFRVQAFFEMGIPRKAFPRNKNYLRIYIEGKEKKTAKDDIISELLRYMLENGTTRGWPAKKYYADQHYAFFKNANSKKAFRARYEQKTLEMVYVCKRH